MESAKWDWRFTTRKRLCIIIAGPLVLLVGCSLLFLAILDKARPPVDGQQIVQAVQKFRADHSPAPETVTFSQLIAQHYLPSNVLESFGAVDVTVNLKANESNPQFFLLDARMPDGSHTTLASDGSIQAYSESRFQQAIRTSDAAAKSQGGSDGSASGQQP